MVVLLVSTVLCLFVVGQAQSSLAGKRVLVLYWYNKDYPGNVAFDETFQSTLKALGSNQIEYYPEYLESNRFPGDEQSAVLRDYLQRKYADRTVDVVVAVSDASLDFLLKYRAELFPQSPLVYVAIKRLTAEQLSAGPGMTGIIPANSHRETLDLALSLHPDTQQVFVVSGTPEHDKRFETIAREQFRPYGDRLRFSYLTDLPLEELIGQTKSLPKHSLIFYLWQQTQNEHGEFLETYDTLAAFAANASAPIYGMGTGNLGKGIVGGYLVGSDANGSKTAEIVVEVLKGKRAQDIPIENAPAFLMFDWRELQRWKIPEASLPPGSIVMFREFTFWQLYKWRIIGLLGLIAIQTSLIVILLIERRRRRRTMKELTQSETRFRNLADNAPVMIWISGTDKLCTFLNQQYLDFTGSTIEQGLADGWVQAIHPDDAARCVDIYTTSFDSRKRFEMEFRLRRGDGEYRWVFSKGTPRFSSDGEFLGYIGSAIDITERKQSEVELTEAHEELHQLKNQLEAENVYLQAELQLDHAFGEIIGQSDAIKHVHFKIGQVAATDSTVLIMGETGTGKELVARAIHEASKRKDRPLIKVNCAALSATLIESELFGHEKGAFTGAGARKLGRFELANGGTIFLDEIGELPLELQVKLLRVIQEGEIERVGGTKTIKIDVRIIAATNRHLQQEVEKGTFREDLWYRLNVFPITAPPLRQRKEDIPLLVEHFAKMSSKKFGKTITSVAAGTMHTLQAHSWPGNVRELANVVERSVIHSQGNVLRMVDRFEQTLDENPAPLIQTLEDCEREHIVRVLEHTSWRIEGPSGAAQLLGLKPSTLRARMAKLTITRGLSMPSNSVATKYRGFRKIV